MCVWVHLPSSMQASRELYLLSQGWRVQKDHSVIGLWLFLETSSSLGWKVLSLPFKPCVSTTMSSSASSFWAAVQHMNRLPLRPHRKSKSSNFCKAIFNNLQGEER